MILIILKFILLFLFLQQLAYLVSWRGLKVQFAWIHKLWMVPVCLVILLLIYLSGSIRTDWLPISIATFVLALIFSCIWPTPGYHVQPERKVCSNGIEYYLFPSKSDPPAAVKVFFHGAGNDALFDNYELFNLWHESGCTVIAVNLPGHGIKGR